MLPESNKDLTSSESSPSEIISGSIDNEEDPKSFAFCASNSD